MHFILIIQNVYHPAKLSTNTPSFEKGGLGRIKMLYYNKQNKLNSQLLRKKPTDAEKLLWSRLRRRQLCDVQFYRQKPILNYIVDFYAPSVNLIIEVDGSQHFDVEGIGKDKIRDQYLIQLNLTVLRFNNLEVLNKIEDVVLHIFNVIDIYKNPPPPSFFKGGSS